MLSSAFWWHTCKSHNLRSIALFQSVVGESTLGQRLPVQTTSTPYPAAAGSSSSVDRITERVTERVTSRPDTAIGLHGSSTSMSYHSQQTTLSSGISSIRGDGPSEGPTPVPQSFMPRSERLWDGGRRCQNSKWRVSVLRQCQLWRWYSVCFGYVTSVSVMALVHVLFRLCYVRFSGDAEPDLK